MRFLQAIETHVDAELEVHVVLDNLASIKRRPCIAGSCGIRGFISTSHRRMAPGSISSSGSLPR